MRYLGIDYGAKRIGVALSDQGGRIAFPKKVISNKGRKTLHSVAMFCDKEKVNAIVLGQSLDYKGKANPIQVAIANWKSKIENLTGLPVHYQSEILTSALAKRSTAKANIDSSAAALILQAYLDKL
ncbi:MAG: hypothetical protein A2749_03175 [Parcubacteria group bacterium RIFCSPHIGHO2_01_FULL_45_26]|nr:MAG: hypothetical protein A2749_03175 [Parcubacteria group bacterium RIFCSPHIGHO2_01_FULL_45_26]